MLCITLLIQVFATVSNYVLSNTFELIYRVVHFILRQSSYSDHNSKYILAVYFLINTGNINGLAGWMWRMKLTANTYFNLFKQY